MKKLKYLSLFVFSLILTLLFIQKTQAEGQDLSNALAEFESDKIQAQDLNIEEPTVLPGDSGYFWQNIKESLGLLFTFDEQKRLEKMEQIASRRLLEARKLSENGSTNATENISEALAKYQSTMERLNEKFENNPKLKEKLLEQFDAKQLRHQELISEVIDKIESQASEDELSKLEKIKDDSVLNWYNVDKEKIQERLESAIEKNNSGSKFKQIKNIATLEQIGDALPNEAGDKVEAAKGKAEEMLAEKINNLSNSDKDKLEKYIENVKTPEIVKQKMIKNLQEAETLPEAIVNRLENIGTQYNQDMKERFDNMDASEQKNFLEQFKNRAHPIYLKFLESIQGSAELKEEIQKLRETQEEQIREKIEQTNDPVKLRSMEKNLENYPALRLQIQEQQLKALDSLKTNLEPDEAEATDNK